MGENNEYNKEPIKTSYGYHIIKKTKEYDKKELKEVKDDIIKTLADKKINEDKTISITALKELRKNKGMKIEDNELKSRYKIKSVFFKSFHIKQKGSH